jgi:heat shock protein HtpX
VNGFKTTILLTGLTMLLILAGGFIGGQHGAMVAFPMAAIMNFFSYFFSDKIALAMNGAQPASREQLPRVYAIVESLTGRAGIPMPKIYVIPTMSPNAFATGRNPSHAAVAVTEGILQVLSEEELAGVLAHELGHVRNRDILTSSIAATLAGAITMLARTAFWFGAFTGGGDRRDREDGGLGAIIMMLLAPIAAMMIQLWVSRTREFAADASAAELTGNPYALASALEKISGISRQVPLITSSSSAHMFIIAPLISGASFASLFSTHPPIQKRIERLIGRPSLNGQIVRY